MQEASSLDDFYRKYGFYENIYSIYHNSAQKHYDLHIRCALRMTKLLK